MDSGCGFYPESEGFADHNVTATSTIELALNHVHYGWLEFTAMGWGGRPVVSRQMGNCWAKYFGGGARHYNPPRTASVVPGATAVVRGIHFCDRPTPISFRGSLTGRLGYL